MMAEYPREAQKSETIEGAFQTNAERVLRRIYVAVLTAFVLVALLFVYSLVKGVQAPRTKVERDIMLYSDLVKKNPKEVRFRMALGQAYLDAKRYKDALESFKEALKIEPRLIDAKLAIGTTYQEMGDEESAIETLESVIKEQPNNSLALMNLSRAMHDKGQYSKALSLLERLKKVDPAEVDAYFLAGQIYEKLGKKSLAKAEYQKIFDFNPDSAEAKRAIQRLEENR